MKAKLVVEIAGDGDVHITQHGVSMENLVYISGVLQQYTGLEVLRRGVDLDVIKDHMLDVHLAAMDALTEEAIRRSRSVKGGKNEA